MGRQDVFNDAPEQGRRLLHSLGQAGRVGFSKDRVHHELDAAHEQGGGDAGENPAKHSQDKAHAVGFGQPQDLPHKRNQMHVHMILRSPSPLASLFRSLAGH